MAGKRSQAGRQRGDPRAEEEGGMTSGSSHAGPQKLAFLAQRREVA